jgi:Ca2+:H+ antiporter
VTHVGGDGYHSDGAVPVTSSMPRGAMGGDDTCSSFPALRLRKGAGAVSHEKRDQGVNVKQPTNTPVTGPLGYIERKTRILIGIALVATIASGLIELLAIDGKGVLLLVVSAVALAVLAALVGEGTDQLGAYLGPGATGLLQSALGNLPELFVAIFALRAGLLEVVQAALIGSILGNGLLVLGLAILVGGLRHGTQRFATEVPRMVSMLTLLAVAALTVPTLASTLHTPAATHVEALSVASSIVVLIVFVCSIPATLRGGPIAVPNTAREQEKSIWPLWPAILLLVLAGAGAALVSEWFVDALVPAMATLHLSETFTGLVVVALAGNAVEHTVGIQFAARNKMDYAVSTILNSSLQVALALIPALVLLSLVLGGVHLTLALPPLLVVAVGFTALLSTVITYDGESTWLEGVALIGLYCVVVAAFWWG